MKQCKTRCALILSRLKIFFNTFISELIKVCQYMLGARWYLVNALFRYTNDMLLSECITERK